MSLGFGFSLPSYAAFAASAFSPASLFSGGAPGVWYDPSDYSTLFQDSAGTTPVTAVEQPVGLMLDKSQGLVLGPELKSNGTVATVGTATAATYNTTTGDGSVNRVDVSNQSGVFFNSLTSSGFYKVVIRNTGSIEINIRSRFNSASLLTIAAGATATAYPRADASQNSLAVCASVAGTATFTVLSVKELPGNHAFQSTSASRPVLSARYNLLTKTEQFDDAAWTKTNTTVTANAIVAPDGTTTADLVTTTASGVQSNILQIQTLPAVQSVFRCRAKAGSSNWLVLGSNQFAADFGYFNLSTGTVGSISGAVTSSAIVDLGNGWYDCSVSGTFTANSNRVIQIASGNGVFVSPNIGASIYIWGASLVPSNQSTLPYQRVNTATDYATTGFLPYLKFDGVDDSLSTNSISFTSTDKMSVFAGVRKLSDAAAGTLVELGTGAQNGSFQVAAPSGAVPNYQSFMRGTANSFASSNSFAAPVTTVIAALGDIAADSNTLRANGAQVAQSTADQGTGNFSNYPLFIGLRNNTSLPFNGQLYSMIIVGKQVTATELSSTETYTASKTGVTLA